VPVHADASEIRRAYHQQCLQWHPDKHTAPVEATRRANTMFKRVTSAYETLSNESKRAEFDLDVQMREMRRRASREAASREAASREAAYAYGAPHDIFHGGSRDSFAHDIHDENLSSTNYYGPTDAEWAKEWAKEPYPYTDGRRDAHTPRDPFGGFKADARPPLYHRWSREAAEE